MTVYQSTAVNQFTDKRHSEFCSENKLENMRDNRNVVSVHELRNKKDEDSSMERAGHSQLQTAVGHSTINL